MFFNAFFAMIAIHIAFFARCKIYFLLILRDFSI